MAKNKSKTRKAAVNSDAESQINDGEADREKMVEGVAKGESNVNKPLSNVRSARQRTRRAVKTAAQTAVFEEGDQIMEMEVKGNEFQSDEESPSEENDKGAAGNISYTEEDEEGEDTLRTDSDRNASSKEETAAETDRSESNDRRKWYSRDRKSHKRRKHRCHRHRQGKARKSNRSRSRDSFTSRSSSSDSSTSTSRSCSRSRGQRSRSRHSKHN